MSFSQTQFENAVQFLQSNGCGDIPHANGKNLLEHLQETAHLLRSWDLSDRVILAGLFHSIYGTTAFKKPQTLNIPREIVVQNFGHECESLIYMFSILDRRLFWRCSDSPPDYIYHHITQEKIAISKEDWVDFLHILLANFIDQISETYVQNNDLISCFLKSGLFFNEKAWNDFTKKFQIV